MTDLLLAFVVLAAAYLLAEAVTALCKYHTRRLCVGILYMQWARDE